MQRQEEKDPRRVFVVHGRNRTARAALFAFLRAIGLLPLEWGHALEASKKGAPFVGEVLDGVFAQVHAVVVLLTGDDIAMLAPELHESTDPDTETTPTPQARPNVLFEAGLALGRLPNATILVQIGAIRPFSDIAGRHIIHLSNSLASRQDLAHRLQTAGCPIDLRGTDWHTEGDFEVPQSNPQPLVSATTSATSAALHPQELAILRYLEREEDTNGSTDFTAGQIAEALSLTLSRAKHYLAELEEKGLTHCSYYTYRGPDHSITREGRAHLVQLEDHS